MAELFAANFQRRGASVLPWFDLFKSDRPPLHELERISLSVNRALLIATADDNSVVRGKQWLQMRDNVLFEYGLFSGRLGRKKTTLMIPDKDDFKIPSDFLGLDHSISYGADIKAKEIERICATITTASDDNLPESIRDRGIRFLKIIAWIRDELYQALYAPETDFIERFKQKVQAVRAFIFEDIQIFGLQEEYEHIEKIINDIAKQVMGLSTKVGSLRGSLREFHAMLRGIQESEFEGRVLGGKFRGKGRMGHLELHVEYSSPFGLPQLFSVYEDLQPHLEDFIMHGYDNLRQAMHEAYKVIASMEKNLHNKIFL